jgi:hypothetical protein
MTLATDDVGVSKLLLGGGTCLADVVVGLLDRLAGVEEKICGFTGVND